MKRTLDVVGDAPSFRDLLLPPRMVQSLAAAGFVRPSPVQQAAIPLARLGADAIVQAKAGTGKTLVFAVAAVERVDLADSMPQVLLLAPTREVALQAADVVAAAAGGLPLCVATLIGGLPTSEDERVLRRICHVVVGTPGRVLALLQRGALVAQRIGMLVLDEADRLLSESFQSDVAAIIEALPAQRQVLALSATYSRDTMAQLRALMRLPAEVLLCEDSVALLGVRQLYQLLPPRATTPAVSEPPTLRSSDASEGVGDDAWSRSLECLLHILSSVSFNQAVVFCNRKSTAESLASSLVEAGHAAGCLSSAHTQLQRIQVVNSLRDFSLRAVVSTDVAARGVDLEGVNLVVHFELPSQAATYMHRVGRAGRFGTRGISVALVEGQRGLHQLKSMLEEAGGGEASVSVGNSRSWNPSSCTLMRCMLHHMGQRAHFLPHCMLAGGSLADRHPARVVRQPASRFNTTAGSTRAISCNFPPTTQPSTRPAPPCCLSTAHHQRQLWSAAAASMQCAHG